MKRVLATGWALAGLVTLAGARQGQQPPAGVDGLTVPDGFDVERIAGPPLVDRPIVADFDEQGRLYVADSSGFSERSDKQIIEKPHRIVRLEDTNGDGRFDKSVVFADRMMFPEGTMWFAGSLYVAAPPSIWKLTDTNGDGVADQREEWFQGKTLTGCANDLHGPYLGPDGWIYWTKGAFAEQTYTRPGRTPLVTRASHIFRRRPGHEQIESVMTGGMDNPVDVAFTSAGERILTATFLEHPQLGRRDAVIHAVYGGVYGKPHNVLDGHSRTGDLMPVMTQLGPAVPAGLTQYASRVFGDAYQDNFFAAMFNLRKVTRNVLVPDGATFSNRESDFLVSSSRDFHPTDVLEDADGSLLVIDTGGWYKICCPTSQLAKPDVLGAIYRIRRRGAPAVADPRGLTRDWNAASAGELTKLLDDPRIAVQHRAIEQLGSVGDAAVSALALAVKDAGSADRRRNAVWALTRIDGPRARRAAAAALTDRDRTVQQAAIHAAALWRDADARPQLLAALKSNLPAIQRAAAEALGRIGNPADVPPLVAAASSQIDRVLEHSLTYALVEIANPTATMDAVSHAAVPRGKRVALMALDQMDNSTLKSDVVTPLLDAQDALLKETAWWVAGHHAEWSSALFPYFQARVTSGTLTAAERDDLQQKLATFGNNTDVQQFLATLATTSTAPSRQLALGAMAAAARTRMKVLPQIWIEALITTLQSPDPDLIGGALSVVRAVPASKEVQPELQAALKAVAGDTSRPRTVRLDALGTLQEAGPGLDPALFELLRTSLDGSQPAATRTLAAAVVERTKLDRAQLIELAEVAKTAGPLEISRLLRAYEGPSDEQVGLALVAALEQSKSAASVRADVIRATLAKYPAVVQARAEAFVSRVNVDASKQAQRLDELTATLSGGDTRRGQAVFNSPKTACTACHAIGYIGGRIGPDLTRIGQVRTERDLLEAIVYPSASFARSYEPVTVTMRSGRVHSGILRSDSRDEVVLGTAAGEEIRLPRQEIGDMQPGAVSLMPPGLADQLTREELADLIAFLKAAR